MGKSGAERTREWRARRKALESVRATDVDIPDDVAAEWAGLPDRQREVCELVVEGNPPGDAAALAGIAPGEAEAAMVAAHAYSGGDGSEQERWGRELWRAAALFRRWMLREFKAPQKSRYLWHRVADDIDRGLWSPTPPPADELAAFGELGGNMVLADYAGGDVRRALEADVREHAREG